MPRRLNAVGPTKKIGRVLVRKKLRISEIVRSGLPTSETFLLSSFTTASYRYRRTTTTVFVYVLRVWPDPSSSPTSACTVVCRNGRSEVTQHPLEPLWDESRRTAEILRRDGIGWNPKTTTHGPSVYTRTRSRSSTYQLGGRLQSLPTPAE